MKSNRHSKILELISRESIDTQEGLLIRLRESGFDVTQATVSRDIRELGIHKVRAENGKYHYVSMQSKQGSGMSGKFVTIFSESVRNIDFAQNIVVIKCFTAWPMPPALPLTRRNLPTWWEPCRATTLFWSLPVLRKVRVRSPIGFISCSTGR